MIFCGEWVVEHPDVVEVVEMSIGEKRVDEEVL